MRKITLYATASLAVIAGQAASAQEWSSGGARTVTWAVPPVIGDGVDRHAEVSTATQGGDPPALADEPAAIDEGLNYTRSAWITASDIQRGDNGEAKFRITCNWAFFGDADPIIAYGVESPHHHTFIGNMGVFETGGIAAVRTADYADLRTNPKSSCSGGPLNATLYWEPSLMYEIQTGVFVPVKPNVVSFYYTLQYDRVEEMYRLLRGLSFIGGVDPADRFNTARLAEIPNGQNWDKTKRYNGWQGWICHDSDAGTDVAVDPGNDADYNTQSGTVRQLVNDDGTDPWAGQCEGLDKVLIAGNNAPSCWDGYNLTSPNGRDHFRYPIRRSFGDYEDVCPQGWWKVPHFEVKVEFPNGNGAVSGHAWRSAVHLSSDRMDANPANWHPNGSTFHFDWMNGWDSVVQQLWHDKCTGTDQDGDTGEPLTCGNSTISATQRMFVLEASPDATMSNDPVITFFDYSDDASKDAFGAIEDGTEVPGGTTTHTH